MKEGLRQIGTGSSSEAQDDSQPRSLFSYDPFGTHAGL
jgi:hypothetical protein